MKSSWLGGGILNHCTKCSPFRRRSAVLTVEESTDEKRRPGGWKCMPYIIGNESFEKVAMMGVFVNLTVYLVSHFNMPQVVAANVANIFNGTANFAPLFGAFVSDAYWGRYRTLAYASVATFLGMLVLTLTTIVPELRPPACTTADQLADRCVGPSRSQIGVLVLSMIFLTVGAGGIRPCSLPFGVDQFDKSTEKGRNGLASFFNWYYCTSTAAVIIALVLVVYVQSVSWTLGLAIPTGLMLVAIVFFFLGTRLYVYVPPAGSVFSGIGQVFVAAYRKRSLSLPAPDNVLLQEESLFSGPVKSTDSGLKLPLTLQYRCLNKAAIKCEGEVQEDGSIANPWRLCTVKQVEETKCLLRIVPIWASGIVCLLALVQQFTFSVLQSMRMDRHIGRHFEIPPALVGTISMIALVLFVPIYDRLLVPIARRITGTDRGITLLQRQGAGLAIAVAAMAVAGRVEKMRRDSCWAHGGANGVSPLSAMWLAPQLILMGIAESFNAVGQIEFYNRQFPEHMQTLAGSLFYCTIAAASYMSSFIVAVIQKNTSWLNNNINLGRVENFYYIIGGLGVVNFFYFLVCSHFYRYKGVPEVNLETSEEAKVTLEISEEAKLNV